MLPQQDFHRRDARTHSFLNRRDAETRRVFVRFSTKLLSLEVLALRLCVSAVILFSISCTSKPTDPRTVIPGDALVYLESNDLGRTLKAITDNPKFEAAAKSKPNLSALNGVKVSVAVTGFESSEQNVTEQNAVLNIQPRFVAVAETNAWGWQTRSFIENQLGEFVNDVYGGEVVLEVTPRADGRFFVWTAQDGRKAYALQQDSLIFFGNDETAIDRCQAVKRGEADSIAKNPKITDGPNRIAFGYISPDGIGQLANIAGVSFAMGASEEEEVKGFVAKVLPEILRNSVTEMTWTSVKTDQGIEDRYELAINSEIAKVLGETIVPSDVRQKELADLIPADAVSATRYNLKDPQIAWRSIVLSAQNQTDQTSGALIAAFSSSVFEPYGVENPELFLSLVSQNLMSIRFDPEGENMVVVTKVKDPAKLPASLDEDIRTHKPEADYTVMNTGEFTVIGDPESAVKCQQAKDGNTRFQNPFIQQFMESDAVAVTMGTDSETSEKAFGALAELKSDEEKIQTNYLTETRFNRNGIERRSLSDFGMIGAILEHLGQE